MLIVRKKDKYSDIVLLDFLFHTINRLTDFQSKVVFPKLLLTPDL